MQKRNIYPFILAGIIVLGFVLRVYQLSFESLWVDEGFTYHVISASLTDPIHRTASDLHPPFYYLVLFAWSKMFGVSELSLRFPSVIFGTAGILLVYMIGAAVHSRQTGLLAAVMTTLSVFLIYYSREARMYQLLLFLSLGSTYSLIRYFGDDQKHHLYLFAGFTTLSLYTHYMSGMLFISHIAAVLFMMFRKTCDRKQIYYFFISSGVTILLFLPWLPVLINQTGHHARLSPLSFHDYSFFSSLYLLWINLSNFPGVSLLFHAIFFLILILSLVLWRHTRKGSSIILCSLFLPIIVTWLAALRINWFSSKFIIFTFPMFYIVMAFGFQKIPVILRTIILCILAIVVMAHLGDYYPAGTKEQFRDAAGYIKSQSTRRDIVCVHSPYIEGAVSYYLKQSMPISPVPETSIDHFRDLLAQKFGQYDNVWLVLSYNSIPQLIANLIRQPLLSDHVRGYTDISLKKNFRGVQVYRFSRMKTPVCTASNGQPLPCFIPFTGEHQIQFDNAGRITVPFKVISGTYTIILHAIDGPVSVPPLHFTCDGDPGETGSECGELPGICTGQIKLETGYHDLTVTFSKKSAPVLQRKVQSVKPAVPATLEPSSPGKLQTFFDKSILTVRNTTSEWRFDGVYVIQMPGKQI